MSTTAPAAPVPLQPLAPTELLDRAFTVLKASPATLLALSAVFVVPTQIATGWLQREAFSSGGVLDALNGDPVAQRQLEESNGTISFVFSLQLLSTLAIPFVAVGIAAFLAARHAGRDPSLGELLGLVLRRSPTILAAWFLVHVAEVIGMVACFVPGLLAMALFMVVAPVIGTERVGPIAAMQRSAQLTRRRYWPTLGNALLAGVVAWLLDQALGVLPDLLAALFGTDGAGWLFLAASGLMSAIITTPFVAAVTTLHYLDLRVRTEGLDLEVELPDAFPAT